MAVAPKVLYFLFVIGSFIKIEGKKSFLSFSGGDEDWSGDETQFILYTRQDSGGRNINSNTILSSNFDNSIPTKFIIHGFTESSSETWVKNMRKSLLKEGNYNVIIVDWEGGADGSVFFGTYEDIVVPNTRKAGARVGEFIKELQAITKISLDDVHLIGFSLGAHVSGFAGKEQLVDNKIGRITGLDPAGPEYDYARPKDRLHRTDAIFVDVVHTNTVNYGIERNVGNLDFYLNGGKKRQPGCSKVDDWSGCSHAKAVEYFIDTIDGERSCKKKDFIAITNQDGKEKYVSDCIKSGLHADQYLNKKKASFAQKIPKFDETSYEEPKEMLDKGTRYVLHTSVLDNQGEIILLNNTDAIRNTAFDRTVPTIFIIPGIEEDPSAEWVTEMYRSLLTVGDYNVISVAWNSKMGIKAIRNAQKLGANIALLIQGLKDTIGISLSDVHLIGFDIGAHVAGYAGKKLYGGIGRITGLDPLGIFYTNSAPGERLDITDAKFVDVIHTEVNLFGTNETMGHLDFYPNGGDNQPGCPTFNGEIVYTDEETKQAILEAKRCNHMKAIDYFTTSIKNKKMYATVCEDYKTFIDGGCTECAVNGCPQMGLEADKYQQTSNTRAQRLYLDTFSKKQEETEVTVKKTIKSSHVTVKVKIANRKSRRSNLRGRIYTEWIGSNQITTTKTRLSQTQHFKFGGTYTYNTEIPGRLDDIEGVKLTYEYDRHWYDIRFLRRPALYVETITLIDRNGKSVTLCGTDTGINPGKTKTFPRC